MADTLTSIQHPDLGERIFQIVRDQIVNTVLKPGEPLVVSSLAKQLGVSRTPVTDALNRLAAEGLVDEAPRKGYFVATVDSDDHGQLMDVRLLLEMGAVESGINLIDTVELDELRHLVAEMETCLSSRGTADGKWRQLDTTFHEKVVGSAHNRHLLKLYRLLAANAQRARLVRTFPSSSRPARDIQRDHQDILAGFESKDLNLAQRAIKRHLATAEAM